MGKTLNLSGEELCALEHAIEHCMDGTIKNHLDASTPISSPLQQGRARPHPRQDAATHMTEHQAYRIIGPDDITVLCFNCNCARGAFGECPHVETRKEVMQYA